jgi:hypothetical protein
MWLVFIQVKNDHDESTEIPWILSRLFTKSDDSSGKSLHEIVN